MADSSVVGISITRKENVSSQRWLSVYCALFRRNVEALSAIATNWNVTRRTASSSKLAARSKAERTHEKNIHRTSAN